ncbi:FecR family protein [Xenophilus arseniciresistens]|uniref:FecR family protein n=1 Tax=Xenophilus arseniciresistens TaxID=1283306 RepID=A0AAE3N8Q4_9BURK|nr:FecR family protein [Xenophilus arseniciresistens]MDA7416873.1 FecR family protein [Xenophilus arseniciresistens]
MPQPSVNTLRPLATTARRCLGALAMGGACLAWLLGPQPAAAQPSQEATPSASADVAHAGVLKSVQGEVQLLRAGGQTRLAQPGDVVHVADRLSTGANGGASLRLRDGTVLIMGAQSQLDLKQYQFDTTTHEGNIFVSLLRGSLRMVSGLIAKKQPEAVRVDTQTATIGIRGTDFIVSADSRP